MSNKRIERVNYFSGEALVTKDFKVEQKYHMEMLQYHNRTLYTYGISQGLDVIWQASSNQVTVTKGAAIDGQGRTIILMEDQLITLDDIATNALYFLTISYFEVYADYTDETGVKGYKRLVQQPKIIYSRHHQQPELDILLAVISTATDQKVAKLLHQQGTSQRQYCGAMLGSINFYTDVVGIKQLSESEIFTTAVDSELDSINSLPSITAYQDIKSKNNFLIIDAPRSTFTGYLTSQNNLGVGTEQPTSNFSLQTIEFTGAGTITTKNTIVTNNLGSFLPALKVGDVITISASVNENIKAQSRTVVAVDSKSPQQVIIDKAFNPDLANYNFNFSLAELMNVRGENGDSVFRIGLDGSVGLGNQSALQTGKKNDSQFTLYVSSSRKVGIGITGEPQNALDVSGTITADNLEITQTIAAGSFIGNGSALTNVISLWQKYTDTPELTKIYYDKGNVAVGMENATAMFDVVSPMTVAGSGMITSASDGSAKIVGYNTIFTKEVKIGYTILVGTYPDDIPPSDNNPPYNKTATIESIESDTSLTLAQPFQAVFMDLNFYAITASEDDQQSLSKPCTGTITQNENSIKGQGTKFTIELQSGQQIGISTNAFTTDVRQSKLVKAINSDTELELDEPFDPVLTDANYKIYCATIARFAGNDPNIEPSLTIISNGLTKNQMPTGTVGININIPLTEYALHVEGNVYIDGNISSSGGGKIQTDDIQCHTLEAAQAVTIGSSSNPETTLLKVGDNDTPTLIVVKDNSVGINVTTPQNGIALDVEGSINVSQTGTFTNVSVTQTATLAELNSGNGGLTVDGSGNIGMLGQASAALHLSDMHPVSTSDTLNVYQYTPSLLYQTDGIVVGSVAGLQNQLSFGFLEGWVGDSSNEEIYSCCSGSVYEITFSKGKKGSQTYNIPIAGSFTLPVGKGKSWTIQFTVINDSDIANSAMEFYWIPLNAASATLIAKANKSVSSMLHAQIDQIRKNPNTAIQTSAATPLQMQANKIQEMQTTIDNRVNTFVKYFSEAVNPISNNTVDQDFVDTLKKLICSPTINNTNHVMLQNEISEVDIAHLINLFATTINTQLTDTQHQQLADAIKGLIEINANDANRHNTTLINQNISNFFDNIQAITNKTFDQRTLKLLNFALIRLVGDGNMKLSGINSSKTTNENTNVSDNTSDKINNDFHNNAED